jgi:hypothetical protein
VWADDGNLATLKISFCFCRHALIVRRWARERDGALDTASRDQQR